MLAVINTTHDHMDTCILYLFSHMKIIILIEGARDRSKWESCTAPGELEYTIIKLNFHSFDHVSIVDHWVCRLTDDPTYTHQARWSRGFGNHQTWAANMRICSKLSVLIGNMSNPDHISNWFGVTWDTKHPNVNSCDWRRSQWVDIRRWTLNDDNDDTRLAFLFNQFKKTLYSLTLYLYGTNRPLYFLKTLPSYESLKCNIRDCCMQLFIAN